MKRTIITILAGALFAFASQAQTGHNFYVQDMSAQGYQMSSSITVQEGDVIRFYNGTAGTFNFEVQDQNSQPNFEVPGVSSGQEIYSVTVDASYPTYNEIVVQKYEFSPTIVKIVEVNFTPSTTSVDEVENQTAIYPNPAQDVLNISSTSAVQEVRILSAEGKLVYSQDTNNSIDIADLQSGVYIVQCTLKNQEILTKQIIKH